METSFSIIIRDIETINIELQSENLYKSGENYFFCSSNFQNKTFLFY